MDAYANYFTNANDFYESIGGVLVQTCPTTEFRSRRTVYAASGIIQFDLFDVATLVDDGLFQAVIEHEMAHVIGFGSLWENNG